MGKNKTTYVLEIDAELGSLEQKLATVKKSLSGVLGSANAPKGLEKTFEKVEGLLDRIKNKASTPIDSKSGFASIGKDINSANSALAGMLKIVERIGAMSESDRVSFLPPEARAEIQAIITGLTNYQKAITDAITETKELVNARDELANAEERVAAAQRKLDTKSEQLENAKKEKAAAKEAIEAIESRKKKLAELKEEQKKIEAFYNTPDESGEKRNRSRKYGGASMRPQDIKKKISGLEKASEGDVQALEQQREAYKKAKEAVESYSGQVNTAERQLADSKIAHKELKETVEELEKEFASNSTKQQQQAFEQLKTEAKKLGIALDDIGDSYSEGDAQKLINRLTDIKTEGLDKVTAGANEASNGVREMAQTCEQATNKLEESTEAFEGLTEAAAQKEAFESKIKSFLGLAGAERVMRAALRDAISTIKELDATMTEMAVVTDLTVGDYWDQLPEYSKRASELGVSINDAYEAATLYYQQGLKTSEVNAISTETLKMARIAGLDAADATDRMTAALRGFNMELNEASAQKISDVYSELAAITAADVNEISTAMTKTASIASSAGMEFETTAAFLSQIIETTRESAETAGTAMKTVIARFQELKKAPDEIGEIDGEIVDANAIETALRSVGVSLRDASGQFRDLDDVFLELSAKWDGLDKNTQRYIATIAAGSRQQSRFIAMMSNYKRTQDLVTAANTSAGASQEQFNKTLEGFDAKLEKLKNAWHEFTMGIMNSDLVKLGIDILTKFLNVVNKATSALDGVGGSLVKIISILTVFKLGQKIFTKLKEPLIDFFAEIVKQAAITGEKAGEAAKEGLKKSQQKAEMESEVETTQTENKVKTAQENKEAEQPEKGKIWEKIKDKTKDKTGLTELSQGYSTLKETKQKRLSSSKSIKEKQDRMKELEDKKSTIQDPEKIAEVNAEIENTNTELAKLGEEQKTITEESEKAWTTLGNGVTKAGQAITGVGVAVSILGGILSEAGLEEAGQVFSALGSGAMIAGTAISSLGPIITGIVSTIVAGGWASLSAWQWVAIVIAGIMVLVGIIALIVNIVKNNSPAAKLKKMEEAAEAAAQAADEAAEAYQNLSDSLDSLEDKYEAIEDLTTGTKEWNEAMKDINNSVLDLINKYPELAKFVKNEGGVLTIDTSSGEVQDVLTKYKEDSIVASNLASKKKIDTLQQRKEIAYKGLSGKERVNLGDINQGFFEDKFLDKKSRTAALAKALAEGVIKENNGTFELIGGEESEKRLKELGFSVDQLDEFDKEIYDSAEALKEYGETLLELDGQTSALYDAMAIQAQQMLDLTKYSQQQIDQMNATITGEDYKKELNAYKNSMKTTGIWGQEKLINDKDTDQKYKDYLARQGYDDIKRIGRKNAVVKVDGKRKKIKKEELLEQMAAEEATKNIAERMANIPDAIDDVAKRIAMSSKGITSETEAIGSSVYDNINSLFSDTDGSALTQGAIKELKEIYDNGDLKDAYEDMDDKYQEAFGSFSAFASQWNSTLLKGQEAFSKISVAQDYMTLEMARAYQDQIDRIRSYYGGEGNAAKAEQLTTDLMNLSREDGKLRTDEEKRAIQNRINATDWSSLESLIGLQIDLEQQYGYTAEQAKEYTESLAELAYASSTWAATVETFGDLWKATEKINQSMTKLTRLQWEYNNALEAGSNNISSLIDDMLNEYKEQADNYQKAYEASNNDIAKIYARGGLDYGTDLREFVKLGANGVEVDEFELQKAIMGGKVSEDDANEWIEQLTEQYSTSEEQLQGLRDTVDAIKELEQQGRDTYYELRDMAKEAVLDKMQKQIDLQQDTLDATRDANAQLISKMQEQIDADRQERQREESEKNISDMRSQLAYLSMDTSGTNDLAKIGLQEQLAKAEQDYQDTLVDQTIQELQDANAKAEEQRERQISLAQSQLDAYENSSRFQEDIDYLMQDMLAEDTQWRETELGKLIQDKFKEGLSTEETGNWLSSMDGKIEQAGDWLTKTEEGGWTQEIGEIQAAMDTIIADEDGLADKIAKAASAAKTEEQRSKLQQSGFSKDGLEGLSDSQLNNLSSFTSREGDVTETQKTYQRYKDAGMNDIKSRDAYYNENILPNAGNLTDEHKTYEQYLADQQDAYLTSLASGIHAFSGSDYSSKLKLYQEYGGTEDEFRAAIWNSQIFTGGFPESGVNVQQDGGKTDDGYIIANLKQQSSDMVKGVRVAYKDTMTGVATGDEKTALDRHFPNASQGWVVMYNNVPYAYWNNMWTNLDLANPNLNFGDGEDTQSKLWHLMNDDYKKQLKAYKTGGLADFTGPAWLDGTKSKPEIVLNQQDSANFLVLRDVLSEVLHGSTTLNNSNSTTTSGDNHFEIEINVEKLENDYDVEQLADKVRRMIYDDASYRNVNAVGFIR